MDIAAKSYEIKSCEKGGIYSTQSTWPSKVLEELKVLRGEWHLPNIFLKNFPAIIHNFSRNSKRGSKEGDDRLREDSWRKSGVALTNRLGLDNVAFEMTCKAGECHKAI